MSFKACSMFKFQTKTVNNARALQKGSNNVHEALQLARKFLLDKKQFCSWAFARNGKWHSLKLLTCKHA